MRTKKKGLKNPPVQSLKKVRRSRRKSSERQTMRKNRRKTSGRKRLTGRKVSRKSVSKRRGRKKSLKKQRGGLFPPVGVGLALGATAALAYAGFRLVSKVNDKSITLGLIDSPIIDYLPKVKVIETPALMNQYLQSLSTMQFYTLLVERNDLFRSQTILNLLSEVTTNQMDIRGDRKIKKLESLIDKLRKQSEVSKEREMIANYDAKPSLTSMETSEPSLTEPDSVIIPEPVPETMPEIPTEDSTDKDVIKPATEDILSENSESSPEMPPPPPPASEMLQPAPEMTPPPAPEMLQPAPEMTPPPAPEMLQPGPEMMTPPPPTSSEMLQPGPEMMTPPPPTSSENSEIPEMPQPGPEMYPPPPPGPSENPGTKPMMGSGYEDSDEEFDLEEYDLGSKLTINRDIQYSRDTHVKNLERHLLATARFPGYEGVSGDTEDTLSENEPIEITPFITVRGVSWYDDVIIKGIYDEDFSAAVDAILEERGSLQMMNRDMKEQINAQLEVLKNDAMFVKCVTEKLRECCQKPRGYMDYIKNNITWDSTKKCLSCPHQDCLIYIYNFYYNFLLKTHEGLTVIDKLYVLIMCEARICVLAKCLCLESIRIQDNRTDLVESLLDAIYQKDEDRNRLLSQPSDKYSEMVEKVNKRQVGRGDPLLSTPPPISGAPSKVYPIPSMDPTLAEKEFELGKEQAMLEQSLKDAKDAENQANIEKQASLTAVADSEKAVEAEKLKQQEIMDRDSELLKASQAQTEQALSEQANLRSQELKAESEKAQAQASELSLQKELKADEQTIKDETATIETMKRENEELQAKITEHENAVKERDERIANQDKELQEAHSELSKYGDTKDVALLRQQLKEELIASLTEEGVKSGIKDMISVKDPDFSSDSLEEVSETFLGLYFEMIHVALLSHESEENPSAFLSLYAQNYHALQFIKPSLVSSRVYGTHTSEGYLPELMNKLDEFPKDKAYTDAHTRMIPCIVLHNETIDDYPVHLLQNHHILPSILHNMIPTLKRNLELVMKLLVAMKKHDRLTDALKFGDPYLLKETGDKYPEVRELVEEIQEADLLKKRRITKDGTLDPGLEKSHCEQKMDGIITSLQQQRPVPITSQDMLFLTQCQKQQKLKSDYQTV